MQGIKKSITDILKTMENLIFNSLYVLFERAKDNIEINDKKTEPFATEGVVQDCEFGMILIAGYDWLKTRGDILKGYLKEDDIETFIVNLVNKTIQRIICRDKSMDKGGEEHPIVFFSGKPYTPNTKGKIKYFSANLDSAMLIIGFLIIALKRFNRALKKEKLISEEVEIPQLDNWVQSLRDAALYVCMRGMEYAEKCQYRRRNEFLGYTCDPGSNVDESQAGYLKDEDRLFFTWTACETINDLIDWKSFVESLENTAPKEEILKKINRLETSLLEAANWCYETFYDKFKNIEPPENIKEFISTPDINFDRIDEITSYIHHVYHLSQYASIRSLSPGQPTKTEIENIFRRLDHLVRTDIIESGLDASEEDIYFNMLTRVYSLGNSNTSSEQYQDDAYYPLVVRSIAGILNRTITSFLADDIRDLSHEITDALQYHFENLCKRRPKDDEDKEHLWSFADKQPFVLYATQRTIYAMLVYKDLLEKIERFESEEVPFDEAANKFRSLLAESLADTLIKPDLVKRFITLSQSLLRGEGFSKIGLEGESFLPEPEWAMETIRDWLEDFKKDFNEARVEEILIDRVNKLIFYLNFVSGDDSKIPDELKDNDHLNKLQKNVINEKENILKICPEIKKMDRNLEKNQLIRILFNSIFLEFVNHAETSFKKFLEDDMARILKAISSADQTRESFMRAVEKASKKKSK